jgi:hypothetical protein
MCQAIDAEHGEPILLVVVAGVVAERAFERVQVAAAHHQLDAGFAFAGEPGSGRRDVAFEHELRAGRRLEFQCAFADRGVHDLGAAAAQEASELVLGERVGHRRHRTEDRRRVGAECDGDRERLARVGAREVAEVERTAAVGEPAHDDLALADHLLAVDAEVLP